MVAGLCRGLLRDRAEAEDAAQQAFLSAHRALMSGASPREPAAWVGTIARNECLARIRARMREPIGGGQTEAPSSLDPVAEALRRADLGALWTAIGALPATQRQALLMREFAGLSYAELALALGVSEPAVESLLSRARTNLRAGLRAAAAVLDVAVARELVLRLLTGGAAAKAGVAAVGVALVAGGVAERPQLGGPAATAGRHAPPVPAAKAAVSRPPVAWASPTPLPPAPVVAVRTLAAVPQPAAADSGKQSSDGEHNGSNADEGDGGPSGSGAPAPVRHDGGDGGGGGASGGEQGSQGDGAESDPSAGQIAVRAAADAGSGD